MGGKGNHTTVPKGHGSVSFQDVYGNEDKRLSLYGGYLRVNDAGGLFLHLYLYVCNSEC